MGKSIQSEKVSTSLIYFLQVFTMGQPLITPFDFLMGVINTEQIIERSSMRKRSTIFNTIEWWAEAFMGSSASMERLAN